MTGVGETTWAFKTTFELDDSLLAEPNVDIVFEGLDTYATIDLVCYASSVPMLSQFTPDDFLRTDKILPSTFRCMLFELLAYFLTSIVLGPKMLL